MKNFHKPKQNGVWENDQERRNRLGLGFLNNYDEGQIKKIIKQKMQMTQKDKEKEKEEQKKQPFVPDEHLQNYMVQKKKRQEQEQLQGKVLYLLDQQRRQENLQKLNQNVKKIFNRSKKKQVTDHSVPDSPKYDYKM